MEAALGKDGRILVRESGTEPVMRVMVEAAEPARCREFVDRIIEPSYPKAIRRYCSMCGIVGYAGDLRAASILLDGLARLEYRGYDSAESRWRTGQRMEQKHWKWLKQKAV